MLSKTLYTPPIGTLQITASKKGIVSIDLKKWKVRAPLKTLIKPFFVIPAKAGIQSFQLFLDPCLRRDDIVKGLLEVPVIISRQNV